MKLAIISVVFVLSGFTLFAQTDSVKVSSVNPEFDFIYRELFNFLPSSTFGELSIDQPDLASFDFNWQPDLVIDFSSFSTNNSFTVSNHQLTYFNPFVHSLAITNQAHYQLNDKFMLGGNSFVGNSIFNPLPANPSLQDMSIRGASMFLQYKVSDKFKIGGSFSISNQNHPFLW
jgi:hypothetical protein